MRQFGLRIQWACANAWMKILFVHQFLGAMGGAETDILLTARQLQRRGHVPALLHAETSGRAEEAWRQAFTETMRLAGPADCRTAREALARIQPDLVYCHGLADLDVLQTLLDSLVPLVRRVHDHGMYCMRGYKYDYFTRAICQRPTSWRCLLPCLAFVGRNSGGRFPIKWVSYTEKQREIRLNRRCCRLVVYSAYQKQELLRNGFDPGKIDIHVPLHLGGPATRVSSFSDRNLVLFVGQILRGKGVDLLLRALAKVTVPFEAAILGDGNHRAYCERLSARLGLDRRVHFHGFVPREGLEQFYADATLLAVSSVWPEPFGLVGREAMCHGLPIVAFDAGAVREWLAHRENGFLVPWKDTNQFAARIEELLRDKDLARRLGHRGLEMVNRTEATAHEIDTLEEMFLRVIGETRGSGAIQWMGTAPSATSSKETTSISGCRPR